MPDQSPAPKAYYRYVQDGDRIQLGCYPVVAWTPEAVTLGRLSSDRRRSYPLAMLARLGYGITAAEAKDLFLDTIRAGINGAEDYIWRLQARAKECPDDTQIANEIEAWRSIGQRWKNDLAATAPLVAAHNGNPDLTESEYRPVGRDSEESSTTTVHIVPVSRAPDVEIAKPVDIEPANRPLPLAEGYRRVREAPDDAMRLEALGDFVDLIGEAAGVALTLPTDDDATQEEWGHRPLLQVHEAGFVYCLVLTRAGDIGSIGPRDCPWGYRPMVVNFA